jgi:ribonuclease J
LTAITGPSFRARIHRGAHQIGGTCVELEAGGQQILLDLGLPLDADEFNDALLPDVVGLRAQDPNLRAIVISHGHADHWGLVPHVEKSVPLAMGAATRRILFAAAPFVPYPFRPEVVFELQDRRAIEIGPFRVVPYLVDHSAFDAYALLVEAGGRRLFYSGDIRAHGRKGALFERLVTRPPSDVDTMLMEGSSLGRLGPDEHFPTEAEIEQQLVDRFRAAPGFVALSASAQNIDRIVSVYRACKRTGRTLLLDLYAVEILKATGNDNIPRPGWPNLAVYVPEYQRRQIKRNQRFDLIDPYKPYRVYANALAKVGASAVMLFRPAMTVDVENAGLWSNATAIWSQWSGYLEEGPGAKLKTDLAQRGIELDVVHTSGHASVADLKRLSEAIHPKALVPIHTFAGDQFSAHFANVARHRDGEWWGV